MGKSITCGRHCTTLLLWGLVMTGGAIGSDATDGHDAYDVVWTSPSADASGSMPLGNGDIGLNAWVEPTGDIVFYISKTDSWGDNGRLLKIGRVRIRLEPPLVSDQQYYQQTLVLRDGTMVLRCGDKDTPTTIRLWVDANHPVIHLDADGPTPRTATASVEPWRTEPYELPSIECSDVHLDRSKPDQKHAPTIVEPDTVLDKLTDRIGWYHHNVKSVGPAQHARTQGMTGYKRPDPLLHRTFGAVIAADSGRRLDNTHLQSPRSNTHRLSVFVLTRHPSSPQQSGATAPCRRCRPRRWW